MAAVIEITDRNDPALAPFRRTEAQLKSRRDPSEAQFVAESAKVVLHAMEAGICPAAFLMERKHIAGQAAKVLSLCPPEIPVYTGEDSLLEEIIGYRPDRCIQCLMDRPEPKAMEEVCRDAKRVAVLENIMDPTNVGALFRCAAALGMDAVLLSPSCCDPLHRRAVRVSMGTVFQVPWARIGKELSDWPERGMERLRAMGFSSAALALTDRSLSIDDPAPAACEKLALVLGTEGDGLAAETIAACDYTLRIPMSHGVDSLNVAAAGAVAFWQLGRHG